MRTIANAEIILPHAKMGTRVAPMALPVEVRWIQHLSEWAFVEEWQRQLRKSSSPRANDSVEYALQARRRWKFVREQGFAPPSLREFEDDIQREPRADLGFALSLANPIHTGHEHAFGFVFVRRTFCNHLFLEFLAASPSTEETIIGVGTQLMLTLALLARRWRSAELWGECTLVSTSFYSGLLKKAREAQQQGAATPFADRFVFDLSDMEALLQRPKAPLLVSE